MKSLFTTGANGLDYNLYAGELKEISLESKTTINTINQYSYCIAKEDLEFKAALQGSDILLPDGEGVVLAERFLTGRKLNKISGTEVHMHLLKRLNQKNGRCFYLGASTETLKRIQAKIRREYPNIEMGYFAPPFKPVFSEAENNEMIDAINSFAPDALFIGLTAPKQEKLSQQFKSKLDVKIICAIGAVFDFYSDTVKRPNDLFIKYKLEWLGRLLTNPIKMWKRYLYYGPIYIYSVLKIKLN
ncbi:MAG: WecB/TagA/CpsF family glycosyltransferase [Cytophagaceae bacterium]|nr:WecB/TagA/CpsF family glycosyltransferase [Cytophagaceae bacterium]